MGRSREASKFNVENTMIEFDLDHCHAQRRRQFQPDVATAGCLSDPAGSPSAALDVIQATHDQDSSIAHR